MTKLVLKTIAFFALVLLGVRIAEPFFIKENRFNYAKYKFDKLADTTNFGILFFGSSKSYCAYNPTIFKYYLGTNSYNLAGQGQVLEVTDFVLEEALKSNRPNLIVVDLSYGMIRFKEEDTDSEKRKSYQLKIFDNYGMSVNKIRYLSKFFENTDLVYLSSPTIRNHSAWPDISKGYFRTNYLHDKNNLFLANNGYIGTMHKMSKNGLKLADEMKLGYDVLKNRRKLKVDDKELNLIKRVHNKAKANGTKVLFVTSPSIQGFTRHLSFYEDLEEHLKQFGINYLNLNKHYYEIGLTTSDFKDILHLNFYGGFKTSSYLSKYLAKHYMFESSAKKNMLDNNVTYNLLSNINYTNKILKTKFVFNESVIIDEIGYFKETEDQYSFVFSVSPESSKNQLGNFRGYIRYFRKEVKEENKKVTSFPIEIVEIDNNRYFFARVQIKDVLLPKFDVFFIDNTTKTPSQFFTLNNLAISSNQFNTDVF
ncbi:MAG: hypothetical protein AAGF96_16925 [Bacteroidota bacterium]